MTGECDLDTLVSLKHPCFGASGPIWGPFESPEIKWNKENVCVRAWCLSEQELGGVLSWPQRARTSQSPSAKQQQTQQLTAGAQAAAALPWKRTKSLPNLLLCGRPINKIFRNWQREKARASDITLLIWSLWNVAKLKSMRTDMLVMSDITVSRQQGFANNSTWQPKNRN